MSAASWESFDGGCDHLNSLLITSHRLVAKVIYSKMHV